MGAVLAALAPMIGGGCDGAATGLDPALEVAGTYEGTVVAATQQGDLDAVVGLSVERQGTVLTGSYTIAGTAHDGGVPLLVEGSGTFTGSIGDGAEPPVEIVVGTPICPEYEGRFSGRFVPASRALFLAGNVDLLGAGCSVLLRFEVVLFLRR